MGLYIGRRCIPGIAVTNDREKDETFKAQLSGAYEACEKKDAVMPDEKTMANLSATIESIVQSEIPKGVAVDGVKWDAEWEVKGQNGTIVDIVVGDEHTSRLDTAAYVASLKSTDPATIDWGDGTTTSVGASGTFTHTYAQPGHYVITVDNKAKALRFGYNNNTAAITSLQWIGWYNNMTAIRRVRQYGSNLQALDMAFRYCTLLNTEIGGYPAELPPFPPALTNIQYAYNGILYDGSIPYLNHISGSVNCSYAFQDSRFTGTAQIMPPKATNCMYMYSGCSRLSCIPYDIFPESNANTLQALTHCFDGVGNADITNLDDGRLPTLWPKISHLTKATTFDTLFGSTRVCAGPLPELPESTTLTSIAYMFYNSFQEMSVKKDWMKPLKGTVNITSLFYGCYNLVGECPDLPQNCSGCSTAFYQCNKLAGTFPDLVGPIGTRTVSLQNMFYNCYRISGQIPELPANVNDLRNTFCNCYNTIGHFPALGHLNSVAAANASNTFYGCNKVTEPPTSWFNDTQAAKLTTLANMFLGCTSLRCFPYDLDTCTATTMTTASMFQNCRNLVSGPKKLPPNVTSTASMFSGCRTLQDSPLHVGAFQKLTNVGSMYLECHNLSPMVDDNGNLETRKGEYYNTRITTYTNMLGYSTVDVMKQFADALVANGKSATLYGNTNPTYDWCVTYKGGADTPV